MKKMTALTAALTLSAAIAATAATAATAASSDTPAAEGDVVTGQVVSATTATYATYNGSPIFDEPIIVSDLITVAPAPLVLSKFTYFCKEPKGTAWGALAPQTVTPTGKKVGEWVEIYTWLGTAWVYAPGYIPYP
ncbi:hypothetical protein [Paenibacillus caui]|uniref:hypothetical protein n=1 Tax=Paenibacillus caui TaxID=2873927 RepID=UPI001CA95520|nr:hypothetical protein [Paenibacillus caui]